MEDHLAIEVSGLVVRYGDTEAVKAIDLDVRSGEILAFLGPNGAGKTSTIEVLEGYVRPAAGQISVLGVDPQHPTRAWRERIGIVLQESTPDLDLTAIEVLNQFGSYFSDQRPIGELLEMVGLTKVRNTRAAKLSGGELRRLEVAMALVGNPELVFLDEPTTGFDPQARRAAWQMIADLKSLGVTVLLTTHYMEEAQFLADRITVISGGEIVGRGTPRQLVDQLKIPTEVSWEVAAVSAGDLSQLAGSAVEPCKTLLGSSGRRMMVRNSDTAAVMRELLERPDGDAIVGTIEVRTPDLEQTYLTLISQGEDG